MGSGTTLLIVVLVVVLILLLILTVCVLLCVCCSDILVQFGGDDVEAARIETTPTAAGNDSTRRLRVNLRNLIKAIPICWRVACPPCPERIIAKLAFHPPNPPSYTIKPDPADATKLLFGNPEIPRILFPELLPQAFFIDIRAGNRIACLFFGPSPQHKYTIVYSHANACDLGGMYPFYRFLVKRQKCNLLAYDYRGYGASTGRTTETSMKEDIMAVASALQSKLNIKPERWILYGHSIGSVPTLHLAAQPSYKFAGVIIESGLLSAFRSIFPKRRADYLPRCCNPFDNQANLSKIKCPVLFIHGMKDKVIPFSLAKEMHQLCPSAVAPFWLPEKGHILPQGVIYLRMKKFITELGSTSTEQSTTSKSKSNTTSTSTSLSE